MSIRNLNQMYKKHQLPPGSVNKLVAEYQQDNDPKKKEIVIANTVMLLVKYANRYASMANTDVSEFVNQGILSVCNALSKYKVGYGTNFNSYALRAAGFAMSEHYNQHYRIHNIKLPVTVGRTYQKKEHGKALWPSEEHSLNIATSPLQGMTNDDGKEYSDNIYGNFDNEYELPTEKLIDIWDKKIRPLLVKKMFTSKTEKRRKSIENQLLMFEMYYGIGSEDRLNLVEIAELVGVDKNRISQICILIMSHVRQILLTRPHLKEHLRQLY